MLPDKGVWYPRLSLSNPSETLISKGLKKSDHLTLSSEEKMGPFDVSDSDSWGMLVQATQTPVFCFVCDQVLAW